jgi:N-acetyl-1-D-myo-inositol-2-amino-2-deoxy-alpha-D-glucopyranoside deacetylase
VTARATGLAGRSGRRLLLVHAHPDDETLSTGLTMARAVAAGDQVTLVTCTLGQEGEVIPAPLRHLTSDADDRLGPYRAGELAAAMRALGVTDHRLLAGGRWRDSGMAWLAPGRAGPSATARPDAFSLADLDEPSEELAAVLREVRPQVVVTYDPDGGYRHPDHVMAHRVTMRAVELAREPGARSDARSDARPDDNCDTRPQARPGWSVGAVHWVQIGRRWAEDDREATLAAAGQGGLPAPLMPPPADAEHPAAVVDDDQLDVVVAATRQTRDAVEAALRAYPSQVRSQPPWFALSDGVARRIPRAEGFRRVLGPAVDPAGRPAADLFAGIPSLAVAAPRQVCP